jgi:hypothetical protein
MQSKPISFLACKKSDEVKGEEGKKEVDNTMMMIILTTSGSGGYVVLWLT